MWSILIAAAVGGTAVPEQADAGQARAAIEARFQRIDRDRNGFITPNEAPRVSSSAAAQPEAVPAATSWIETYDSDGDARISPAEYLARSLASQASAGLARR